MGMLKEFKEFALRGNVMDMAVGVIIGGAFQKIVTSMVGDMIMPAVSALLPKGQGIKSLHVNITTIMNQTAQAAQSVAAEAAKAAGVETAAPAGEAATVTVSKTVEQAIKDGDAVVLYGKFLSECIDFIILAFCIFMMVKLMNYLMKKKEEAPPPAAPPADVALLTEIRDLLAKRG